MESSFDLPKRSPTANGGVSQNTAKRTTSNDRDMNQRAVVAWTDKGPAGSADLNAPYFSPASLCYPLSPFGA